LTQLLISTSWRHTNHNQPSGRLLVFDVEQRKVVRSCQIIEPPFREYDPNPRGGFRGLKGISIEKDLIAIANASTIFLYNNSWEPIRYIFHPSCAGIHDIYLQNDLLWVTSSRNDLICCFNLNGKMIKHIDVRKFPIVNKLSNNQIKPFLSKHQIDNGEINFRDPRTHDHAITDALHINSFMAFENGDYLVSCGLMRIIDSHTLHKLNNWLKQTSLSGLYSRIYQYYRKAFQKDKQNQLEDTVISKRESSSMILRINKENSVGNNLVLNDCLVPSHSLRSLSVQKALYLNSSSGELIFFDLLKLEIHSKLKIGEKFLRGARQLDNQRIVIGDNNHLILWDSSDNKILSRTLVAEDPDEAIFDINILPDHYLLPPESFVEHHKNYFPVDQENYR